jgi:hypothetical protein
MQQRQLRLGDILDDYCPRERRLTNHAVVAMVGEDVKQTRCTTCDTEHEYKHAKIPRQRRRAESQPALYAQALAGAPKRVPHEGALDADAAQEPAADVEKPARAEPVEAAANVPPADPAEPTSSADVPDEAGEDDTVEEGPVHRPLIRATLPRAEGQPPPARPAPDFTIRQPGGRPGRFRPRPQRGGPPMHGNRANGLGPMRSGVGPRHGGRPPDGSGARPGRRHGPGRKRSK